MGDNLGHDAECGMIEPEPYIRKYSSESQETFRDAVPRYGPDAPAYMS